MSDTIYSVSQLNQTARLMLENQLGLIWLTGEISNFTQPVSGHWYLTLKDENAQVRCAMFRQKNLRATFRPQNGQQVLVRASVSLYEPRGDYQLIIESIHPAGEGALQQQFEALKNKLAAEGLFATHFKKKLPHFTQTVGIITSQTGAALQDILQILQRRDPSLKIVIYPTSVQGKDAAFEITEMLELANKRQEVDVLIVGRGGGSLEDLWCFNEEVVARAIFHSQLPIISAVGHETDITISDFVADLRAPTPSAAAELVSRNQAELMSQLEYQKERLTISLDRLFQQKQYQLQQLTLSLQHRHPQTQWRHQQYQLSQLAQRLITANKYYLQQRQQAIQAQQIKLWRFPFVLNLKKQQQLIQQTQLRLNIAQQHYVRHQKNRLAQLSMQLQGLSPLNILARGYSITQNQQGKNITQSSQIKSGEKIITSLAQGKIISQIIEIQHNDEKKTLA